MDATNRPAGARKINWQNVSTVLSAAVLIAAEVFGAAFAGGYAIATLFELGTTGGYIVQAALFLLGLYVMVRFVMKAQRIEPFFG